MDLTPFEAIDEAFDHDFCQWFVGWTEGTASFNLDTNEDKPSFVFEAALSASDLPLLEYVQSQLQMGEISTTQSHFEAERLCQFTVSKANEIAKLIVIFEEYTLQAPSKQTQFGIWQEAFYCNVHRDNPDAEHQAKMKRYAQQLSQSENQNATTSKSLKKRKYKQESEFQLSLFDAT